MLHLLSLKNEFASKFQPSKQCSQIASINKQFQLKTWKPLTSFRYELPTTVQSTVIQYSSWIWGLTNLLVIINSQLNLLNKTANYQNEWIPIKLSKQTSECLDVNIWKVEIRDGSSVSFSLATRKKRAQNSFWNSLKQNLLQINLDG